jgi:hypothetical protein
MLGSRIQRICFLREDAARHVSPVQGGLARLRVYDCQLYAWRFGKMIDMGRCMA